MTFQHESEGNHTVRIRRHIDALPSPVLEGLMLSCSEVGSDWFDVAGRLGVLCDCAPCRCILNVVLFRIIGTSEDNRPLYTTYLESIRVLSKGMTFPCLPHAFMHRYGSGPRVSESSRNGGYTMKGSLKATGYGYISSCTPPRAWRCGIRP